MVLELTLVLVIQKIGEIVKCKQTNIKRGSMYLMCIYKHTKFYPVYSKTITILQSNLRNFEML